MQFSQGKPLTDLIISTADANAKRGTRVVFKPDPTIFKTTTEFDFDKLANRLDELAYLNAGLTLTMSDRRGKLIPRTHVVDSLGDSVGESKDYSRQSPTRELDGDSSEASSSGPAARGKSSSGKQSKSKLLRVSTIESHSDESNEPDSVAAAPSPSAAAAVRTEVYRHDGGIKELISVMCDDKTNLHEEMSVIYCKEERKGITVEVRVVY